MKPHKYTGHLHCKAFKRDVFMSRRHSYNTGSRMCVPGNIKGVRTFLVLGCGLPNEVERLKDGMWWA